jgi:hypothetical protein
MASSSVSELAQFHQFLGEQLKGDGNTLSPEESLVAFRGYQRDLEKLRNDLQPAIDRLERGESAKQLDIEDIKRRGRQRLAREGIGD